MNIKNLKKYAFALTLTTGFVIASWPATLLNVQAQDRTNSQNRRGGEQDRRGNQEDQRNGYRDGLNRGQSDARGRRRANFNNSEQFRDGNRRYKDGFRKGYNAGYRQHRRW